MIFLGAAAPREIQLHSSSPPVLVFGDGVCEATLQGVGAIALDTDSALCEAFGGRFWEDLVNRLRRAARSDQIIGQLDIIPFLPALRVWGKRACGQPGRWAIFLR